MAVNNANLHRAREQGNDEFYTSITDIEKELKHYKSHFKGKTVLCNCDDPRESNFYKFFQFNFKQLGLKKLISTCYKNQDADLLSQHNSERAVWIEYTGNGNSKPRLLKGDGDFRSNECIELLKEADIVVTNPPFSLFREYVAHLIKNNKKFIIMGSNGAVTYRDTFSLLKNNTIWLGVNNGGDKWFQVPFHYENNAVGHMKIEDGVKFHKLRNVNWYTNLTHKKRHEELVLVKKYKKSEYPKYDGYKVINVNRVKDIPADYYDEMGVPITFLDNYNPNQFEILGIANSARWIGHECFTIINGKKIYNRIIIKRKSV